MAESFLTTHHGHNDMSDIEDEDSSQEIVEKLLKSMERLYGFVPLVNQVLSERPEFFIPQVTLAKAIFNSPGSLSEKERELIALGAATACSAEHCMMVHLKHADRLGADKDQIMEAMMIGSMISMNKAQSYAFRKFREAFEE